MSKKELLYTGNKLSLNYFNNLIETNIWKAFATIHAGIHHQLRIILRYKFDKDENGKPFGNHKEKWKIIEDKSFAQILRDLFITGIIDEPLKNKLSNFNNKRNRQLGHINIYDGKEVSDEEIKELCKSGIEIGVSLDDIIKLILFRK
ncbi:hypothetical protein HY495_00775 [Candidatus Woesearchaeota archaeon]|nr:hypothetical protein [Candidatus Woesearchaeota archaeon]